MVGYTKRRKTYKVFIPAKGRVVETPYVICAPHAWKDPAQSCSSTKEGEVWQCQMPVAQGHFPGPHESLSPSQPTDKEPNQLATNDNADTGGQSIYGTPMKTMAVHSTPNCPPRQLCTGSRLDNFFAGYLDQDEGDYAEIIDQRGVDQPAYSNLQSTPSAGGSTATRPRVAPPPPPSAGNADEPSSSISPQCSVNTSVTSPPFSPLTECSASTSVTSPPL